MLDAKEAGASEDAPEQIVLLSAKSALEGRIFVIEGAQGYLFAALEDAKEIEEKSKGRGFA